MSSTMVRVIIAALPLRRKATLTLRGRDAAIDNLHNHQQRGRTIYTLTTTSTNTLGMSGV